MMISVVLNAIDKITRRMFSLCINSITRQVKYSAKKTLVSSTITVHFDGLLMMGVDGPHVSLQNGFRNEIFIQVL